MNHTEETDDYESITDIKSFESLLNNMNEDKKLQQINKAIEKEQVSADDDFYIQDYDNSKRSCRCKVICRRSCDFLIFFFLFFDILFCLFSEMLLVIEFSFSFYSVILMSYVFFISSIISYAMAPIYKIMSGDYVNFALSLVQVVLTSPLISFYIFYIVKSVKSLGEFFSNSKQILFNLLNLYAKNFKNALLSFCSGICDCSDYKSIFHQNEINETFFYFTFDLILSVVVGSFFYVMFFYDNYLPLMGFYYYIFIVFQIILSVFPSYIYFFQTLFNKKCRKFKYIEMMKFAYKKYGNFENQDEEKNAQSKKEESKSNELKVDNSESEDLENNESLSSSEQALNCWQLWIEKIKDIIYLIFDVAHQIANICIRKYDENKKEEEEDEDEISDDIENIRQINKKYKDILKALGEPLIAKDYLSIYYFSTKIAFDRHNQCRKMAIMYLFLVLNIVIISYDIYQLTIDYSDYLLASIIIRTILIPPLSYFNICSALFHKAKDKTIRYIHYWSLIITIVIVLAACSVAIYTTIYQSNFRIHNLDYVPPFDNTTVANENTTTHPICDVNIYDVSAFDSFGYALGGFDVKRNKTVFDNQMKIFFGENYSSHINYTIYELDKYFLFLKFYDSDIDTTIFAFRGYNSNPEFAFQLELFASQYILPFFEDVAPFLEEFDEFFLSFYNDFFHSFGLRFFENRNLMVNYINSIRDIYNKEKYNSKERVLFTGINTGGVIAKILGTLLHRKSLAFISFPMKMDFLEYLFHFDTSNMIYVTNVFNADGFFSKPDGDHSINIAIDTPSFHQSKFCSSDFCEVFSKFDNIYRTFCTISEICGKGNQFSYYCIKTIGEKNLEIIRDSLQEEDE